MCSFCIDRLLQAKDAVTLVKKMNEDFEVDTPSIATTVAESVIDPGKESVSCQFTSYLQKFINDLHMEPHIIGLYVGRILLLEIGIFYIIMSGYCPTSEKETEGSPR